MTLKCIRCRRKYESSPSSNHCGDCWAFFKREKQKQKFTAARDAVIAAVGEQVAANNVACLCPRGMCEHDKTFLHTTIATGNKYRALRALEAS